ncbi:MAG: polysaccharide deacetylase family protein [Salibacter sp.]|uniref:polysaccharide deacetylase family protein n=1 Tax=Salibacter sp. TaxID=2010995 RepID=UPI0028704CAF|nr:polysaccharide deacetylase family protein [Salibacter sp.]MDR9399277.1 polysaccharide deacetylase family protein [Salibacter sp.]
MYSVKIPGLVSAISKKLIWRINTAQKVLFLTFDDGPIPDVTPKVLGILKDYNAKATFFGVGENMMRNSGLVERALTEGHVFGTHTYNHLNGWKTSHFSYLKNYLKAEQVFSSGLFRPPYGRITPRQIKSIHKRSKIVMWDVLSGDFDRNSSPEQCAGNVIENAKPGSIIVFHDSLKAEKNMFYALRKTLEHFSNKGYRFEALTDKWIN